MCSEERILICRFCQFDKKCIEERKRMKEEGKEAIDTPTPQRNEKFKECNKLVT